MIVLDIQGSPLVPNQNITPNEDGALLLKTDEGDLENRGYLSSNHAELIRDQALSYITWKEIRTWMEWPVELPAEQAFEVYARIATKSSDNKIVIEAGGEKAVFNLPDTGGLENFKVAKIGRAHV